MDAAHPYHNPIADYGWTKQGKAQDIRSNTGRQRLNINGAIDCTSLCPAIRYEDTINAQLAVALLQQIEQQHPLAQRIHIICGNAWKISSRMTGVFKMADQSVTH